MSVNPLHNIDVYSRPEVDTDYPLFLDWDAQRFEDVFEQPDETRRQLNWKDRIAIGVMIATVAAGIYGWVVFVHWLSASWGRWFQ